MDNENKIDVSWRLDQYKGYQMLYPLKFLFTSEEDKAALSALRRWAHQEGAWLEGLKDELQKAYEYAKEAAKKNADDPVMEHAYYALELALERPLTQLEWRYKALPGLEVAQVRQALDLFLLNKGGK